MLTPIKSDLGMKESKNEPKKTVGWKALFQRVSPIQKEEIKEEEPINSLYMHRPRIIEDQRVDAKLIMLATGARSLIKVQKPSKDIFDRINEDGIESEHGMG